MDNNVYLQFGVNRTSIVHTDKIKVTTDNRNYIYARFDFGGDWDNVASFAIFSNSTTAVRMPILDGVCQVPNEVLVEPDKVSVSVYGGDLKTVNTASFEVVRSGYKEAEPPEPSEPTNVFVQSPGNSIPFIREEGGSFQYLAGGEWNTVTGGGGKGDKGDKGDDGASATVTIGTVTTGEPGSAASVENAGTELDAVLNFTIPRGDEGIAGITPQIIQAADETTAISTSLANPTNIYFWVV